MKKRTSKDIFADTLFTLAKQEPLERITVKQIVEASGLSLQTFYNHFKDKDALILWMRRRMTERFRARIENGRCGYQELIMDVIGFYAGNTDYLRSNFGGMVGSYTEFSIENSYAILAAFVHRKRGPGEIPEELSVYMKMYIYACLNLFLEWSLGGQDIPAERLAFYLKQGMPEMLKPYLLEE